MNMEELIIKNLMEQLELERDEITPESRFIEDFSMDSLDMVEMLIDLEKQTGVKIPNEEIKDIRTVGELVKYLEAKKG